MTQTLDQTLDPNVFLEISNSEPSPEPIMLTPFDGKPEIQDSIDAVQEAFNDLQTALKEYDELSPTALLFMVIATHKHGNLGFFLGETAKQILGCNHTGLIALARLALYQSRLVEELANQQGVGALTIVNNVSSVIQQLED